MNWLCDPDMLPSVIPEARIFTFDWNAKFNKNAPVDSILNKAKDLLAQLNHQRLTVCSSEYSHRVDRY